MVAGILCPRRARVERSGDATPFAALRSALEESLGVTFEGDPDPPWSRPFSTASSPPGFSGVGRRHHLRRIQLARLRLPPAGSSAAGTVPADF